VTVGVAGVIIVPWAMILGVVIALGAKCTITCVDEMGQEIDLDGKAVEVMDAVDKATEGTKMSDIKEIGKNAFEKGKEAWDEFSKEGGKLEQIEEKGKEAFEKGKETFEKGKEKGIEAYEKGKETFEKVMADEKVNNAINEAKKVAEKAADKAIKFAEETQIKR